MASIGLGFLGEPAIAKLVEPIFGGVLGHGVAVAISVTIAYTIVTAAHVIVGEQAPKMLAITRPERVLQVVGDPVRVVPGRFPPGDLGPEQFGQLRGHAHPGHQGGGGPGVAERRGAEADDRPRGRRPPRQGRGKDAQRRLPPARAGGQAGDDADPGSGDRERRRDRRDRRCASASPPDTPGCW